MATLVAGVLLGSILLVLIQVYRPALIGWIGRDPTPRLRQVGVALAVAFAAPAVVLAVYFWSLGDRVVGAARFPAPGRPVARDTVVLRGSAATGRGRLLQGLSALLVAAAAGVCVVVWRFVSGVGGGR